jgi:hypothetical protein
MTQEQEFLAALDNFETPGKERMQMSAPRTLTFAQLTCR